MDPLCLHDLFIAVQMFTVRRVAAGTEGLALVRSRSVEEYHWESVRPTYRVPRYFPMNGRRYATSLTAGAGNVSQLAFLTHPQAEAVATQLSSTVLNLCPQFTWATRASGDQQNV
jgi:hypothetical protein